MKVLIVDDSGFSRSVIATLFAKARPDWGVEYAPDAETALSLIEAATPPFSLITVDIHMPGMNGVELVDELRKREVNSAISLLTANVQAAAQGRAKELGVSFVGKPLNIQKLNALLAELAL
jgi:CheY-like chemotaxis protein